MTFFFVEAENPDQPMFKVKESTPLKDPRKILTSTLLLTPQISIWQNHYHCYLQSLHCSPLWYDSFIPFDEDNQLEERTRFYHAVLNGTYLMSLKLWLRSCLICVRCSLSCPVFSRSSFLQLGEIWYINDFIQFKPDDDNSRDIPHQICLIIYLEI